MTQLMGKNGFHCLLPWAALFFAADVPAEENSPEISQTPAGQRFVIIESAQKNTPALNAKSLMHCVFDKNTRLTWEIKSKSKGLQHTEQTYSWYEPNMKINGGYAGYRNQGKCELVFCDTQSYIARINQLKLCGRADWRLPTREELRSLINYNISYPGPSINQNVFPNTKNQFYWSATPDANDSDSAWGIGFSFGYDYAYFKNDHGYIRLVSGPN